MKPIIFAVFLVSFCNLALAQAIPPPPDLKGGVRPPDPRILQLEIELNSINQAQQSLVQQFQMVQEMRRNEIAGTLPQVLPGGGLSNLPPPSYDDTVRLQREREDRIQQYTRDLDELYSRYSELNEQKKAVIDQLMELSKARE